MYIDLRYTDIALVVQVLMEAERVLVPGGRFMCMEFCPLENPYLLRSNPISMSLFPGCIYISLVNQTFHTHMHVHKIRSGSRD